MKNLIWTMQIGGTEPKRKIWEICTPSIKQYAEKIGVDFHIQKTEKTFTNNKHEHLSFFLNKFIMFDFLKNYDRILVIDSDVLINPAATDIFKEYPDVNTFYGMDEGYTNRAHIVQPYIDKYKINWKLNQYGTYRHYNGGVYIISKGQNWDYDLNEYLCIKGYEENFLNYIIQKNNIPNETIDRKWNKICSDNTISRREAYFIHYAGPGHVEDFKNHRHEIWELKIKLIQEDYNYFYKEIK